VIAANADLTIDWAPARATAEQYDLFRRYQADRHGDGDMARMDPGDFRTMIEVGALGTVVGELRDRDGVLVGACLTDRMARGMSAVYHFFDPALARRSLGTRAILWLIEQTAAEGLDFVYLGYWIAESRKMAYKARFQPLEALTREGWRRLEDPAPSL
jgi:arginine-tRNA-protein transferase